MESNVAGAYVIFNIKHRNMLKDNVMFFFLREMEVQRKREERVPLEAKEGLRSPGARVIMLESTQCGFWELGPLEQQPLSTSWSYA